MGSFSDALAKFNKLTDDKVDAAMRKIGLSVFRRIIVRTPVDTGRARGNWQASFGQPRGDTIDRNDKSGTLAVSAAIASAASWKPATDGSFFITNNLPYIGRLENGYSRQAPAGMVAITVTEFAGLVQDASR